MKRILGLIVVFCFAYINISCLCLGPKLDERLVESSDLIIEGKIIDVKYIEDTTVYDLESYAIVTFKVIKLFKGEKQKTFKIKNEMSSQGFLSRKHLEKYIGRKCILYVTKTDGEYDYHGCENRILFEEPIKKDHYVEYYKENLPKYLEAYKKEKEELELLLKQK